ncbi:MAG: hypothetical protein ACR2MP_12940 [Streptosporangiaceae bacterium]
MSLWLNAGVPAAGVARRAGHGVVILLKVYSNCIDGQDGPASQRINGALGGNDDSSPAPGPAATGAWIEPHPDE